jgi:hypothetical protein
MGTRGHKKGVPRPDEQINAPPGENARRVRIARVLMSKERVDTSSVEAVTERFLWYLDVCEQFDDRPTLEGFALATGYDRVSIRRIKEGEVKSVPEEVRLTLKRVWDMLNQMMTQYMVDGHLNPVTAIFLLKNNFGYRDQTETVVVKKDPYETGNPEEIARKYLSGMAPALDAPHENAREAPIVETVVIDQSGTVE